MRKMELDPEFATWLGDYVGLALGSSLGFVTYADNSENKAHIRFAAVAAP